MQECKCGRLNVCKFPSSKLCNYEHAIIRAYKYATIKVRMCVHAIMQNKGMYNVCLQVCKYIGLQILKYQLCKYESI